MPGRFNLPKDTPGLKGQFQLAAAGSETKDKGPEIKRLEIWSKRNNKVAGTAANLKSARRLVDKYDDAYGAYDHYIKRD